MVYRSTEAPDLNLASSRSSHFLGICEVPGKSHFQSAILAEVPAVSCTSDLTGAPFLGTIRTWGRNARRGRLVSGNTRQLPRHPGPRAKDSRHQRGDIEIDVKCREIQVQSIPIDPHGSALASCKSSTSAVGNA